MKLKVAFFAFLLSVISLCYADSDSEKPFVTCWLRSGQLGNQLFEIAATLAYAWDNNIEPLFPGLNANDFNLPINQDRIFFRLNTSPLPRPILNTFNQLCNYEKIDIPLAHDQLLVGYFQTWKYFDHHKDKILEIFAPHPEEVDRIKSRHSDLLKHPNSVGIHVRTFNKKWSTITPFVGLKYYNEAISLFPEDALFVVFSDRINWCKKHFAKFKRPMIFIENQDHIEDLILMSLLKHNIIGNSTFSWWAAYFNQNPDKIVVAPSHFVHPSIAAEGNPNYPPQTNPNLPDWITIDIDYNYSTTPYPEDICDYDTFSKSIDTQ